jgi:NADH:ubiquinone oxidoreductase subunit C
MIAAGQKVKGADVLMMGVTFKGNKNLRPLLLEDWHDIPPHRKDYVLKRWPDEERARHGLRIPKA